MDIYKLIAEVKQRPALWNSKHTDHNNRVEAMRLWREVSDIMGYNVESCRTKWKNLRCSYRRQQNRQSALMPHKLTQTYSTSGHQWPYTEAMSFLHECTRRRSSVGSVSFGGGSGSTTNDDDDFDVCNEASTVTQQHMLFKQEPQPDEMETIDNESLMQQFQDAATPQALRRLSHSISLASAAAEEQETRTITPESMPLSISMPMTMPAMSPPTTSGGLSATAVAAASSCQCAKRVDEQVHFLQDLEREEQQLMQSTSQDISRCKNVLHVGDSDYNFLISFLPLMKQMSSLQNVAFRAKMGELLLQTMSAGPPAMLPQQQQQHQQQQQQQHHQLQQQQRQQQQQDTKMALDQSQVSASSTTNWN